MWEGESELTENPALARRRTRRAKPEPDRGPADAGPAAGTTDPVVPEELVGRLREAGFPVDAGGRVDPGRLLDAVLHVAVRNAREHERMRTRERRLAAIGGITIALLSGGPPEDVLPMVAARARDLAGADLCVVHVPDPDDPDGRLVTAAADGPDADRVRDRTLPVHGSVTGRVFLSGVAEQLDDVDPAVLLGDREFPADRLGPVLLLPLAGPGGRVGTLAVARVRGAGGFDADARAITESFAAQAALALELARTQRSAQRLAVLEDRERIAVELQDNLIQRLFATGMRLESVARRIDSPELRDRLVQAVDDLDLTIRDTRRAIYALQAPPDAAPGFRQQVLSALAGGADDMALAPAVHLEGPLDLLVGPELAAVATAAVQAAVRSAADRGATAASVTLTAQDTLHVVVRDDGRAGSPDGPAGLLDGARRLGGEVRAEQQGAEWVLHWEVPLVG